jgi:hypothetical protein
LGEGGQPKARWRVGSRTNKMDVFMYLYFFWRYSVISWLQIILNNGIHPP